VAGVESDTADPTAERAARILALVLERAPRTLTEVAESAGLAPVRERSGGVVAALAISGATLRMAPHRLRLLGRVTVEQAHALSTRLGHESALEDVLS
jgi:DNA-binding IclR family transcriptional regulator